MQEKKIYISPDKIVEFFGTDSSNIEKIKSLFPNLNPVFRGNEIQVSGSEKLLNEFTVFIHKLEEFLERYHSISGKDIELIFQNKIQPEKHNSRLILYGANGKPIVPCSSNQQKMEEMFRTHDLLFALGPAGTGKTYLAVALAVRALKNGEVRRLILSRPAVEAGESLGFLPGDLKDKLDPYLQALYDALSDILPSNKLRKLMEQGDIQIAPLAYMRGRTLSHATVVLDEAQNTTVGQLKMFLTRMGEHSKFIVTGDVTQIDLPSKTPSGLVKASKILPAVPGIGFVHFSKNDIIRHPLVAPIVEAFEKDLR